MSDLIIKEMKGSEHEKDIKANSRNQFFYILLIFFRYMLILIIYIFFYSFNISKSNYEFPQYQNLTYKILIPRSFTVIIQSSNKTKWRLNKVLKLYYIKSPHIHIYVSYGKGSIPDPNYNYIISNECEDLRRNLHCKNTFAYNFFLQNESLGDFLYRAMDDTLLNLTNLEKLINQLREIYDPFKHLVFRGFANEEKRDGRIFLGGGSGWLMSRALVSLHQIPFYSFDTNVKYAFYKQDDTAETIIIRKIGFKNLNVWDDPRWAESGCTSGNFNEYSKGNFNKMENCSSEKELINLKEMIALHSVYDIDKEKWIISRNFPSFIYGYRVRFTQCVRMCKSFNEIVNKRTTFKYLKENAEYITIQDIMRRNATEYNYTRNYIVRNPQS